MRITVDVDEKKVGSILELTCQKKMSPAVAMALDEFIEFRQRQAFLAKVMAGKTRYEASNEEIEALAHTQP
jgi:hypothetical protein